VTSWADRFRAFVTRKEAEARAAALSPLRTEIARPDEHAAAIGNDWSRRMFDGPFFLSPASPGLPATSLVFVQSRDRNTAAADPSTLGGGDVDKHLIYEGLSRVAADAVMAGATTVRAGNLILSTWLPELVALRAALGLPRHPTQIVATLRGLPFDRMLLFNVPEVPVVLITVAAVVDQQRAALAPRPWVAPVVLDDPGALRGAFGALRARGVRTLSCIGGRTLARQLIDAGLVRDLYLTTTAIDGGEPHTPLYPAPLEGTLVVRKRHPRDGIVFEHTALGTS